MCHPPGQCSGCRCVAEEGSCSHLMNLSCLTDKGCLQEGVNRPSIGNLCLNHCLHSSTVLRPRLFGSARMILLQSMQAPENAGCYMREKPVPWNECFTVMELGVWLILSTVASHFGRAHYLLLVLEVAGTVLQLCGKKQEP